VVVARRVQSGATTFSSRVGRLSGVWQVSAVAGSARELGAGWCRVTSHELWGSQLLSLGLVRDELVWFRVATESLPIVLAFWVGPVDYHWMALPIGDELRVHSNG
jgi:hypothetical protein